MDRETMRGRAREIGRVGENVADSVLDAYLNEANRQFQTDVLWYTKTVSVNVHAKFSMGTAEAFKLTIAKAGSAYIVENVDVVLATAQSDVSGATLASALQAIIQGSGVGGSATTMAFSETTRKFTIEASAESSTATSVAVSYPASSSYYDKSYDLFGGVGSTSGTTHVGDAAPYCTSEYALPSDFIRIKEVIYDNDYDDPLSPEIYKRRDDGTGTPNNYSIYTKGSSQYMRLTPQPTTIGDRIEEVYYNRPSEITTGLAGDSLEYDWPDDYHMALVHYCAYLCYMGEKDETRAAGQLSLYNQYVYNATNDKVCRLGGALDMTARGRQGL